ncbi:MAG: 23S rRNA (adenine(2503)-C(2))-methyltransferase RlmN [Chloroflexi bacterium]|nr:23S rRNA (adenine(2503)-C(2))-methyltransferase RlmN [Chloroflexota bacterium]
MPLTLTAPITLFDLNESELEAFVVAHGGKAYWARQLWHNLYRKRVTSWKEMPEVPSELRRRLAEEAAFGVPSFGREQVSADGTTRKLRMKLHDGASIETVLMEYRSGRKTVCVSSQVGCAVGCPFCATGEMGLFRNLTPGEIIAQVLHFARQHPINNLVFMGMGEPFLNYDNTWKAITILNSPNGFGMGPRRFTLSTSGIIPGIMRLAEERLPVNLAVSLHAPNDDLRRKLVPVSAKYPLADLLAACDAYTEKAGRHIIYEYVLLADVNDSDDIAHRVGRLLQGKPAHVNLIPVNPSSGGFYRPSRARQIAFQDIVRRYGVRTTIRAEKGIEIGAACGQLATARGVPKEPR